MLPGLRSCVRCLESTDRLVQHVPMCLGCEQLWVASPECRRLALIATNEYKGAAAWAPFGARWSSIFAEWVERLRCEENVENTKKREAAALAASTPKKEDEKT